MKKLFMLSSFFMLFTASFLAGQEKKAGLIVTNYFNWLDAGNLDAVVALLTDDFKATAAFAPVAFDKKGWRGVGENFVTAYPGMKHEILDWFADDNKVVVSGIFKAKNTGINMGNPPTGNAVAVPFTTIFELDGKSKIKTLDTKFDMKLFESQLMAGINPHARNEANIRKAYASLENRDYKSFASVCSEDFSEIGFSPDPIKGVWNAIEAYKPFLNAFPDIKFDITSIVPAAPNTYYLTIKLSGTNTGSFMGIPPTGKHAVVEDMDVVVLNEQGLCISHKSVNPNGLLYSIGIMHKLDPRNAAAEASVLGIMAAADAGDTEKLISYFAPDAKHYFNGIANTNDELKNGSWVLNPDSPMLNAV
ncbi:MAG: ester cyclase [Saprospiraceae bacterium]|nr:ester cyclase [Saprospiraceae bacterium]